MISPRIALLSMLLLPGCVSVGYMNRQIQVAKDETAVCRDKLEKEMRLDDDLRAMPPEKREEYNIKRKSK